MRTAHLRSAAAVAAALATAALLAPTAPAAGFPPQPDPHPDVEVRPAPPSVFAGTAIGAVLEANGNEVPRSGAEMMAALARLGEFAQLPVTFSTVDTASGLTRPRVVITPKPSLTTPPASAVKPKAGANPFVFPDLAGGPAPVQTAVSTAGLTKPNLEGRLFLAANMEGDGELKVKTFEFISWNSRRQRFDFGFIECGGKEAEIRLVDGVRCFICHKNRGPILGQGPWSNSTHNDSVRSAVAHALRLERDDERQLPDSLGQPHRLDTGFDKAIPRPRRATADGVAVLIPQGPAVDAAVRLGADLARDRDVYRHMLRTADGRRTFALLLAVIASPGDLKQNNDAAKARINREFSTNFTAFAERAVAVRKAAPDALLDFGPAGSQGRLRSASGGGGGWGGGSTLPGELRVDWGCDVGGLNQLDAKRLRGESGVPSNRQPSNPKAFVPPDAKPPRHPADLVSAVALARLIGVTEGDRSFLANTLHAAADRLGRKHTPAAVAKEVFAGPAFAEVLSAGVIPDREDFKDRFARGVNEVLRARGAKELALPRAGYASGPSVAPVPGKEEREPAVVPTTACLRCHDVRVPGVKPGFSPIPLLAFDPLDKAGREAWAKAAPAADRAAVLGRLARRVFDDRDMPPEDSAEFEHVRLKDPDAFAALRTWLEAELAKAK